MIVLPPEERPRIGQQSGTECADVINSALFIDMQLAVALGLLVAAASAYYAPSVVNIEGFTVRRLFWLCGGRIRNQEEENTKENTPPLHSPLTLCAAD